MAKAARPIVREIELKMALGEAVTRAVYKAPPSLLKEFRGDRLLPACRRLSFHVLRELEGDGWRPRGRRMGDGDARILEAIEMGMLKAGPAILRSLPYAQACDDKCDKELLEGIGADLGEHALRAMRARSVEIEKR